MKLDCGIGKARIDNWLAGELALERIEGCWVFTCDGAVCRIATAPLAARSLGPVKLERTDLTVEGDEAAIEAFMHLFTLQFISAGG